jgi:hypothetical protein
MGYHIILKPKDSNICSVFVHTLEDLAGVHGISDDSIVYEGDETWRPFKVGASEKFRNFSEDWFRAGIKAQKSFRKLAEEKGCVLETDDDDRSSIISQGLQRIAWKSKKASAPSIDFPFRKRKPVSACWMS